MSCLCCTAAIQYQLLADSKRRPSSISTSAAPPLRQYAEATIRMALSRFVSELRVALTDSEVLMPGTPGYDQAIKRWNAALETRAVYLRTLQYAHDR